MSPSTLVRVQWVLEWFMPSGRAEALLGDLLEERRLRLHVGSPVSVARWYWKQLASSLPVLLWASLHRRSSYLTLVIAVASYFAAGGVAFVLRAALSPVTTSTFMSIFVDMLLLRCHRDDGRRIRRGVDPSRSCASAGRSRFCRRVTDDGVQLQ